MTKKILSSLFILFTVHCNGQDIDVQDSVPIVSYADKIIIKANFDTRLDAFSLKNRLDNSKFKIVANNSYRLFLSLDYEFIGASIGFTPDFFSDNTDEILKGKSSFSDFRFRIFLGKWVQGIQYSKIRGYYVENTIDYLPTFREGLDPYLQIPNLTNKTWGMSTSYVFNPKFSYRNVLYQTEWQKKSAGSFVPTLFYDYNTLSFQIGETKSKENAFNLRLALNYYYTLVLHKNWFLSPYLSPSLGFRFSESTDIINDVSSNTKDTYGTRLVEGGLQIGYSSKRVIFGGSFNFNKNWYDQDSDKTITNDQLYALLYFGYRFDSPKFIAKPFNWLNQKLGISE